VRCTKGIKTRVIHTRLSRDTITFPHRMHHLLIERVHDGDGYKVLHLELEGVDVRHESMVRVGLYRVGFGGSGVGPLQQLREGLYVARRNKYQGAALLTKRNCI